MRQLHPRATWLFFINFILRWFLVLAVISFYSLLSIIDLLYKGKTVSSSGLVVWILVVVFVSLILLYAWARLTYYFYRYELTENGFRKELGVIWKKYVTIPYDRIQNVDIYRGVWARVLGLSDLHIQTAGLSATGKYGAGTEGRLPGLAKADAEALRDELIRRAKHTSHGQGL